MLALPLLDVIDLQQEVRIGCGFGTEVEHYCGSDQVTGRNLCHIETVAPSDPVNRCVEMRADVLAGGDVVPIPDWPAVVIPAYLLQRDRNRVAERLKQPDQKRFRAYPSCEMDDLDGAQA